MYISRYGVLNIYIYIHNMNIFEKRGQAVAGKGLLHGGFSGPRGVLEVPGPLGGVPGGLAAGSLVLGPEGRLGRSLIPGIYIYIYEQMILAFDPNQKRTTTKTYFFKVLTLHRFSVAYRLVIYIYIYIFVCLYIYIYAYI